METRYPLAKWDAMGDAGAFLGGPKRGVIHRTQGKTYAGARSAYLKNRSAPHFTIAEDARVYQHADLNRAARSMKNLPGGVETNRWGSIQVEVVGMSSEPWTLPQVEATQDLMIWIEAQTGIQPWAPPFVSGEAARSGKQRMTLTSWLQFPAWCGHQHVPENDHWDPGLMDAGQLATLFDRGRPAVPEGEIRLNHPPRLILATPTGGGYWIVAYDGGMFAFGDAPADSRWTAIGGDPVERIISGTVFGNPADPASWGAWLMGEDGGVFSLGAAQFRGRVFFG